jgi:hypothetical protein
MKVNILIRDGKPVIFNYGTDMFEFTETPLNYSIDLSLSEVINNFVNYYVKQYKVYPDKSILDYFGNCKLTAFELVEVKEEKQFVPAY